MQKPMNERRQAIRKLLKKSTAPMTGAQLAETFSVTRQVIVQDMAILRAEGLPIIATPNGYLLLTEHKRRLPYRIFICKHTSPEAAEREMMEIVRHGGYLLDVIIEHPFYGEITGQLRISTPEEVEQAIVRLSRKGSGMLSSVTDGVHMHTVEAEREEQLDDIEAALDAAGILCTD